jgi:hypothetical protein
MAEQDMQDDNLSEGLSGNFMDTLPSMLNFNGTDSPTFTFNRPAFSPTPMDESFNEPISFTGRNSSPETSTPKSGLVVNTKN